MKQHDYTLFASFSATRAFKLTPARSALDRKRAVNAPINTHLKNALVLSPRRRRGNLDTASRVRFLGRRPSNIELLKRFLGGRAERRDPGQFDQMSQPVVVFIEEQFNRISVETRVLFSA